MSIRTQNLTVASGATVSTVFPGSGFSSFGMVVPAGVEGTAVTFEVGYEDAGTMTWMPLNNLATAVSLTIAASKAYKLPDDLRPFGQWRLLTAAQSGAAVFVVFAKSDA